MLYILFGATANLLDVSKEYLMTKHKLEEIPKYHYHPKGADKSQFRHPVSNIVTKEELARICEYRYSIPCRGADENREVGFTNADIMDAVHGRRDCFITLSAVNVDFIRSIKAIYKGYVTTVCIFIDQMALEKLTEGVGPMSEEERARRLGIGRRIKEIFVNERDVFDEVVVYTGEDTMLNFDSLFAQYDFVIDKAKRRQLALNDDSFVEMPYEGAEPFIFVSYARRDRDGDDRFDTALRILQNNRCRVWYDKGIPQGAEWEPMIRDKIHDSTIFLLFVSKNSTSTSSYVSIELDAAKEMHKPVITVRLDDSRFALNFENYLSKKQNITFSYDTIADDLLTAVRQLDDGVIKK